MLQENGHVSIAALEGVQAKTQHRRKSRVREARGRAIVDRKGSKTEILTVIGCISIFLRPMVVEGWREENERLWEEHTNLGHINSL